MTSTGRIPVSSKSFLNQRRIPSFVLPLLVTVTVGVSIVVFQEVS